MERRCSSLSEQDRSLEKSGEHFFLHSTSGHKNDHFNVLANDFKMNSVESLIQNVCEWQFAGCGWGQQAHSKCHRSRVCKSLHPGQKRPE